PSKSSCMPMARFELIGRIVENLYQLDDIDLQSLLTQLEDELTDETITVITYGADDTEHLLSSPRNAEILNQAVEDLKDQELLTPESFPNTNVCPEDFSNA
ncbi:MAG: hypothetical protein AAFZ49_16740, partial [Cyanobacteria bacterium J06659_2]